MFTTHLFVYCLAGWWADRSLHDRDSELHFNPIIFHIRKHTSCKPCRKWIHHVPWLWDWNAKQTQTSDLRGSTIAGGTLVIAISLSDWLKLCQVRWPLLWLMALSVFRAIPEMLAFAYGLPMAVWDIFCQWRFSQPFLERKRLDYSHKTAAYIHTNICIFGLKKKSTNHGNEVKLVFVCPRR